MNYCARVLLILTLASCRHGGTSVVADDETSATAPATFTDYGAGRGEQIPSTRGTVKRLVDLAAREMSTVSLNGRPVDLRLRLDPQIANDPFSASARKYLERQVAIKLTASVNHAGPVMMTWSVRCSDQERFLDPIHQFPADRSFGSGIDFAVLEQTKITEVVIPLDDYQQAPTLDRLDRNTKVTSLVIKTGEPALLDTILAQIKTASAITRLEVSGPLTVEQLGTIAGLTQLVELVITDNELTDFSKLTTSTLPNLTKLTLNRTRLQDIGFVSGLVGLRSLDLAENQIVDLSPIVLLPTLAELSLAANAGLEDILAVRHLDLKVLDISKSGVTSLAALGQMASLEVLAIHENKITTLEPIANLHLKGLYAAGVHLQERPVELMKGLNRFELDFPESGGGCPFEWPAMLLSCSSFFRDDGGAKFSGCVAKAVEGWKVGSQIRRC